MNITLACFGRYIHPRPHSSILIYGGAPPSGDYSELAFLVCSISPLFAQFSLLFIGINMLQTIYNQLKAVSKHYEEVSSCFDTYGCHAIEKDLFFLH